MKTIDEKTVFELARIGCTYVEMAQVLGCSKDTLRRRFKDTIKKGLSEAKQSVRRKQLEVAMAGNVSMLIWLGKNLLGQTDKVEQKVRESGGKLQVVIDEDFFGNAARFTDGVCPETDAALRDQ